MNKRKIIQLIINFISYLFLIFIDQSLKLFATFNLKGKPSYQVIPGVLEFAYLENEGAAFGILKGQNMVFYLISALVFVGSVYLLIRTPNKEKYRIMEVFLVMLVSGTVGNVIDRIRFGYVIDFIYFSGIGFPVFNIADLFVSVASIGLIILILFVYKETDLGFLHFKILKYREIEK